jgi:hypothetical protein
MENEWYRVQLKSFQLKAKHQKNLKSSAELLCCLRCISCRHSTTKNQMLMKMIKMWIVLSVNISVVWTIIKWFVHYYWTAELKGSLYTILVFSDNISFILIRVWSQWLLTGSRTRKEIHENVFICSLFIDSVRFGLESLQLTKCSFQDSSKRTRS